MRTFHVLALAALLIAAAVSYVSCGSPNSGGNGLFPTSLQYNQPAAVK